MFKESSKKLVGNDAFEGYAIDLIHEIAQILSEDNLDWLFLYSTDFLLRVQLHIQVG